MDTNTPSSYEIDFAAWAQHQAMMVRLGKWEELDQGNLVEELEALSRHEQHQLESRLEVLMTHLLKWQYQPTPEDPRRGWRLTILEQRRRLSRLLHLSPTLRPSLPAVLIESYPYARRIAHEEMGLPDATLPAECPWKAEQVLDDDFWPDVILRALST